MSEDKLTKWLADKLLGKSEDTAKPVSAGSNIPAPKPVTQGAHPAKAGHPVPRPAQHRPSGAPHAGHPSRGPNPHQGNRPHQGSGRRYPTQAVPKQVGNIATPHGAVPAHRAPSSEHVRIMALGGLNEVGRNSMIFEYEKDILIVDLGFQFPDEAMLGIDYIIPDISYLQDKKDRIRGILLTHGHLDHVGAIPYLIEQLGFPPVYGTKLTLGIVKRKLEEFGLEKRVRLEQITADDNIRFGKWDVSFFRVNHSIPDAVGIVLKSPHGTFVHTGDFKFDLSPAGDQRPAEFDKIAQLGNQNITALFSDSTNALRPGHTMSEAEVARNLEDIIKNTEGRLIIAAFSSLIARVQQIMDFALKYRRKVYITGRSMMETLEVAKNLGYLKYPKDLVHDAARMGKTHDNETLILTTGSQGESVSALSRIALGTHPMVKAKKGDTVILSSSPIIGNERSVNTVIVNLCRLGVKVIHNKMVDVHTSGHASAEDLKLMITLVHPKYLIPVHGDYYMRQGHMQLGFDLGMKQENGVLVENGDVIEFKNGIGKVTGEKISTNYVLVDGLGTGDTGNQVMLDRQMMSENGVLVVLLSIDKKSNKLLRDPDIISRGFIYMNESEEVMAKISKEAKEIFAKSMSKKPDMKRGELKNNIKLSLEKSIQRLIERRPLILPIVAELDKDGTPPGRELPSMEHKH